MRWRNGHAMDCKSIYIGSIPVRTSRDCNKKRFRSSEEEQLSSKQLVGGSSPSGSAINFLVVVGGGGVGRRRRCSTPIEITSSDGGVDGVPTLVVADQHAVTKPVTAAGVAPGPSEATTIAADVGACYGVVRACPPVLGSAKANDIVGFALRNCACFLCHSGFGICTRHRAALSGQFDQYSFRQIVFQMVYHRSSGEES